MEDAEKGVVGVRERELSSDTSASTGMLREARGDRGRGGVNMSLVDLACARRGLRRLARPNRDREDDDDGGCTDCCKDEETGVAVGTGSSVCSRPSPPFCILVSSCRSCSLAITFPLAPVLPVAVLDTSPTPTFPSHQPPKAETPATLAGQRYTFSAVPSNTHTTRRHFLSFACTPDATNSIFRGTIAFRQIALLYGGSRSRPSSSRG